MTTAHSAPSPEGVPGRVPPARTRTRASSTASPAMPNPDLKIATEAAALAEGEKPAYAVGYKKPPRHSQFQKGRSGNPKGRPKQAKGIKTIARDTLTQKVEVRTATGTRKMSRMEAVMHKTVELAMKGNPRAVTQLIALYAAAVPDPVAASETNAEPDDLTATDLATLDALRRSLIEGGPGQ